MFITTNTSRGGGGESVKRVPIFRYLRLAGLRQWFVIFMTLIPGCMVSCILRVLCYTFSLLVLLRDSNSVSIRAERLVAHRYRNGDMNYFCPYFPI